MKAKTFTLSLSVLMAAGAFSLGCGDQHDVDIGGSGSLISDYAAHWEGYAEAYTFRDGSDRIRLTLDQAGNGTLEVGDSAALPPATDPTVGYPTTGWDFSTNAFLSRLAPGFQYSIYGAHVETQRIRLGADFHDLWATWCPMQTPYCQNCGQTPMPAAIYECAPIPTYSDPIAHDCRGATDTGTGEVPIDCAKQVLCNTPPPCTDCTESPAVCSCNATSCAIPAVANGNYPVKIDGALEAGGNRLVGTLVVNDGTRFTVRLTRN
jgi:hypothetical protein